MTKAYQCEICGKTASGYPDNFFDRLQVDVSPAVEKGKRVVFVVVELEGKREDPIHDICRDCQAKVVRMTFERLVSERLGSDGQSNAS